MFTKFRLLSIAAVCMLSACAGAPAFAQSECRSNLDVIGSNAQSAFVQFNMVPTLTVFLATEVPLMVQALNVEDAKFGGNIEAIYLSDRADALLLDEAHNSVVIFSREGCFTGRAIVGSDGLSNIMRFLVHRRT